MKNNYLLMLRLCDILVNIESNDLLKHVPILLRAISLVYAPNKQMEIAILVGIKSPKI